MLGGMLAGSDETPGEIRTIKDAQGNLHKVKVFRGMASKEAQVDFMGGMSEWKTAEGVSVEVKHRGPVKDIIQDIMGGIRSGMTYCGAATLKGLQRKVQFIEITHAAKVEGQPHAIGRLTH
jgi:IMP dehydrogenase